MAHMLSAEAKEQLVCKGLSIRYKDLPELAQANNIGLSTLARWMKKYKNANQVITGDTVSLSKAQKLEHILAVHGLEAEEVGSYCRSRGFYAQQISQWKLALTKEDMPIKKQADSLQVSALAQENRRLLQDIDAKIIAIRELSAVLSLKKKVDTLLEGRVAA